jgi:hypothetical protein
MEQIDWFVAPFYFIILLAMAINMRNKKYNDPSIKKYFVPALLLKFTGAIFAGLVYYFYYTDGDTRGYFRNGTLIYDFLFDDLPTGLALLFPNSNPDYSPDVEYFLRKMRAFGDPASYMMYQIVTVVNFLALNTYSSVALIFAYVSFITSWKFYALLTEDFPELKKQLAYAILFIPSVVFWGSGIFKDTVCLSSLMVMIYTTYKIFLRRNFTLKYFLLLGISVYTISIIKTYILLCFMPPLATWVFLTWQKKIKNNFTRIISTPVFVALSILSGLYMLQKIGEYNPEWAMDNVQKKAYDMQEWHTVVAYYAPEGDEGGGSFYTLGDPGDFSIMGMIKKFPLAVNVTLFRPYLWEARTPFVLISALESLFFLILTIRIFMRVGIAKFFTTMSQNPLSLFAFLFSMTFAFGVGYTSYNFGALVRYKIPCMPFYLIALFITEYYAIGIKKQKPVAVLTE